MRHRLAVAVTSLLAAHPSGCATPPADGATTMGDLVSVPMVLPLVIDGFHCRQYVMSSFRYFASTVSGCW